MLGDEREQPRGRIRAVDRTRGAGEIRQYFDEHGRPIRRADSEEFRDTGSR